MNPYRDDTWWKRAFTVVAIGLALLFAGLFVLIGDAERGIDGALIIFVAVFLAKMGVCYIVEGQTPPKPKEPNSPSN